MSQKFNLDINTDVETEKASITQYSPQNVEMYI